MLRTIARRPLVLVCAALLCSTSGGAQPSRPDRLRAAVREYRAAHEPEILRELSELLAIPNVASDSVNIRRNAALLVTMLERRGVRAQLLEVPGAPPAVFGELRSPGATRTIVLYAHYDGQPVDTSRWTSPPWRPVLRTGPIDAGGREVPLPTRSGVVGGEWRIYARSASDDKAPIVGMLAALDALRARKVPLSVNVKFFFEGEEEAGSPHLRELLERHAELLRADVWLFCDGPVHQSRRQQVVFGVRGTMGLELTTYGPIRALHSGHYGNWAPNPVAQLNALLASMRDETGQVRIAGFLDDVRAPSAAERAAVAAIPNTDAELRQALGLGRTEGAGAPLAERIMLPAVNFRGIRSGQVGALAANAIPTEASASIDFRLVPDQTPARVRELVEAHVRAQGFHIVHDPVDAATLRAHPKVVRLEWEKGYPGIRTAMDLPVSRAVLRVVREGGPSAGGDVIAVPTLGGSLPMYLFSEVLRVPLIVVPTVNHDNNQHAADENLRLQNLWDSIETFAALMARLGVVWR